MNIKLNIGMLIKIPLLLMFLYSCTDNTTYRNREQDIMEIRGVAAKFYQMLKDTNYYAASTMFSKRVFEKTPREEIILFFRDRQNTCGTIISNRFFVGRTVVNNGSKPVYNCNAEFDVVYEKCGEKRETLYFIKEDRRILIKGYRVP